MCSDVNQINGTCCACGKPIPSHFRNWENILVRRDVIIVIVMKWLSFEDNAGFSFSWDLKIPFVPGFSYPRGCSSCNGKRALVGKGGYVPEPWQDEKVADFLFLRQFVSPGSFRMQKLHDDSSLKDTQFTKPKHVQFPNFHV